MKKLLDSGMHQAALRASDWVIAPRVAFLHHIGKMSWSNLRLSDLRLSDLKLVAIILLCTAMLSPGQMLLPLSVAASADPAGCHSHIQFSHDLPPHTLPIHGQPSHDQPTDGQPARTPTSHQCCATGHSSLILTKNTFTQNLHDFSSYVVTDPGEGNRSRERLFFTPFVSSSSPPITAPLRV